MPRENRVDKSRVHFSCQAQYLVKLECDFSWQAQHLVTFWEIAGARNVFFSIQNRVQGRTSKVSEAAGARCDFLIGLSSDYPRIVFILAEAIQRVSAAILNSKISLQAQYLLRLEVDIACSAHCK